MSWRYKEKAWGIELLSGGLMKYTFHGLAEAENFISKQNNPDRFRVVEVQIKIKKKNRRK